MNLQEDLKIFSGFLRFMIGRDLGFLEIFYQIVRAFGVICTSQGGLMTFVLVLFHGIEFLLGDTVRGDGVKAMTHVVNLLRSNDLQ